MRLRVVLSTLLCALLVPMPGLAGSAAAQDPPATTLNNDITDVTGVLVGHVTDAEAHTGATVVYAPATATAGVDVRGGSALTRETDVLKPTNEVQKLNAVLLTGGGEYGLAAGPGVMEYLRANNQGFPVGFTPDQVVPIVPGAAINDLRAGRDASVRPTFETGFDAAEAAASGTGPIDQGNVGAGAGAVSGGLKGGLGSASVEIAPGIVVAALVVVDSVGSPVDLTQGCTLLGTQYGEPGEFADVAAPTGGCGSYALPGPIAGVRRRGGVIGVVATNVTLDKAMNQKVAEIAHDGVTRSIGPAHSMGDGDTFFAISTDVATPAVGVLPDCLHAALKQTALGCQLFYNILLGAAQTVVSRAVAHAVLNAESVPGLAASYCDTFAGACGGAAAAASSTAGTAGVEQPGAPPVGGEAPDVSTTGPGRGQAAPRLAAARGGLGLDRGVVGLLAIALTGVVAGASLSLNAARLPRPAWSARSAPAGRSARRQRRAAGRRPRRLAMLTVALLAAPLAGLGSSSQAQEPILPDDPRCQSDAACLALVDRIGEAAKRTMGRAIVDAMISATTEGSSTAYCDQFPGACAETGPSGYPNAPGKKGRYNNLTDVPGLEVGTYTDPSVIGTSVVLAPEGAHVGVEVRGSAPGGRGTDHARSEAADDPVHALILTGGSAFGLAAADGVAGFLEEKGLGQPLGVPGAAVMPVIPTSVIFDLGRFGRAWTIHATPEFGLKAAQDAKVGDLASGNVGGGAGAQAGGLKGGLGHASQDLGDGIVVAAMVDVNAFGSPVDVATGCTLLSARYQLEGEFGGLKPPPAGCDGFTGSPFVAGAGENTTIGIVATNVPMSRALLSKLAQYGQDGLALGMRPSHTYFDGDTVWAVSTGKRTATTTPTPEPTAPPVAQPKPGPLPATGGSVLAAVVAALAVTGGAVAARGRRRL